MPLTANDGRRNAAAEGDPLMLTGPDIIHYAELLIRFRDHPVLSPHYQFWGNLADYLNRIMHLPERPGKQNDSSWSEFNSALAMAAGYITMSGAPAEYKRDLLTRFFPPEPDPEPTTAEWFADSKVNGCTGTSFNADNDTISHEGAPPCPVHPGA
jgi:hypothetical protein